MRCAITGMPVTTADAIMTINDGLPCSPPLQLHTRMVTHDGSRTFTRNALRAMHDPADPRPALTYEEINWHTLPWAEQELFASFPRDLVEIVLLIRRDGTPIDYAMSGSRYDIGIVKQAIRLMGQHIRGILHREYAAA